MGDCPETNIKLVQDTKDQSSSTEQCCEHAEPLLSKPRLSKETVPPVLCSEGGNHINTNLFNKNASCDLNRSNDESSVFGSHCSCLSTQTPSLVGIKISYELTPYASTLSSLHPVCRICQNSNEKNNILITPCRCDGSLKHVHGLCLRRWIETRAKRRKYAFRYKCELCGYEYRKRKFIKCTVWRLPRMRMKDKMLHLVFLLSLFIMVVCAVITIQCLVSDTSGGGANKYRLPNGGKSYLTVAEVITLTCGIVFFVTFIMAMTVEIKAKHTIYQILRKMLGYNTVWLIENYNKEHDTQYTYNPRETDSLD